MKRILYMALFLTVVATAGCSRNYYSGNGKGGGGCGCPSKV